MDAVLSKVVSQVSALDFLPCTVCKLVHRVLDPLLFDLHDPLILRTRCTEEHNGRSIQGFRYDRPFDQRYVSYLLDSLLSVVKFGGQGFGKIARTTMISRSSHAGLLERIQSGT